MLWGGGGGKLQKFGTCGVDKKRPSLYSFVAQFPARPRMFLLATQMHSGAHPDSHPVCWPNRRFFPGVERPECKVTTVHQECLGVPKERGRRDMIFEMNLILWIYLKPKKHEFLIVI
jgi:hypothetical protein